MSRREAPNEMERGSAKYRNWVHEESKRQDSMGNLPFKFSKPRKSKPSNVATFCTYCGHEAFVTDATIMVICARCKKLYKVSEENSAAKKSKSVSIFIWDGEDEKGKGTDRKS